MSLNVLLDVTDVVFYEVSLFLPERIDLGQLLNVILFWRHHLQCTHVLLSCSYPSRP